MLKPNGEDLDKPLGARTRAPSVEFWARQPTWSLPQQLPIESSPVRPLEQQTILDIVHEHTQNWPEIFAVTGHRGFRFESLQTKPTPFHPDRIPGPVQFLLKLLESWDLTPADATALLGFEQTDAATVEGILAGRISLRGRDIKDRLAALVRIKSLVSGLFREGENAWMRAPVTEFGHRPPIDMLREGSMQNLLTVRQYVEYISGL